MERPSVQKVMLSLCLLEEEMNRLEKENRELDNENIRLNNKVCRLDVKLALYEPKPKSRVKMTYEEYLNSTTYPQD